LMLSTCAAASRMRTRVRAAFDSLSDCLEADQSRFLSTVR
jgi:hypothetical protein